MPYKQPEPSPIETAFWNAAKERIPDIGREVWIERYRVDFLVRAQKVVVELYGFAYHNDKRKLSQDAARERFLQRKGYRVLRFMGSEVYKDSTRCVQEVIDFLQTLRAQQPNPWTNASSPVSNEIAHHPAVTQPINSYSIGIDEESKPLGFTSWQVLVLIILMLVVCSVFVILLHLVSTKH